VGDMIKEGKPVKTVNCSGGFGGGAGASPVGGGGADLLVVFKVLCRTFFVFIAYIGNVHET